MHSCDETVYGTTTSWSKSIRKQEKPETFQAEKEDRVKSKVHSVLVFKFM